MGVFASRSPFRPNSLGLSVVRNEGLRRQGETLILRIRDHDLIEGTPILDIKPYLAFADAVAGASLGWADAPPVDRLAVLFSAQAETQLHGLDPARYPDLRGLIEDVVAYDPRPSFRRGRDEDRIYGAHLYDLNVRFRFVTRADESAGHIERPLDARSPQYVEVLTVC
jgi:hypothetical protein